MLKKSGVVSNVFNSSEASKSLNLLFVCTGNTCRSVMAQGLLQKIWSQLPRKNVELQVSSAGIGAIEGMKASEEALIVLAEEGIDLRMHSSRRITGDLVKKADIILVMTCGHKDMLCNLYPQAKEKIWLLNEFAGVNGKDIPDPIGMGLEFYRRVAAEIKKAVEKIVEKLNDLNNVEKKTGT